MGLFDVFKKKDCEICGKEVGMFGYKKLEDGEICKDCVKLLSPWFDDRRHSTVEQIKQQLAYRENNRSALDGFRPTLAFGENYTLRAELENGVPTRFVVERGDDYRGENADLIIFRDVTSFEIDVQDSYRELKRRNSEGEEVSYVPPRYEYSYDFYAVIRVNCPYFDVIRFKLNRNTLNLETVGNQNRATAAMRTGLRPGMGRMQGGFDPTLYPEYRQYQKECDELEELFRAGMQGMMLPGQGSMQAPMGAGADAVQGLLEQIRNAPDIETAMRLQTNLAMQTVNHPNREMITQQAAQALTAVKMRVSNDAVQPTAPAAPVPPAAPAVPKFCPNCGAPTEGSKFCQSCGSKLI